MLYHLIRTHRGKETVMMTDEFTKVRDRQKLLRASQNKGLNGSAVRYDIKPAEEGEEKYRKPSAAEWMNGISGQGLHTRVPKSDRKRK